MADPMIIRARVRARLLGLHLLTLDARITAESESRAILAAPVPWPPVTPVPRPGIPARPAVAEAPVPKAPMPAEAPMPVAVRSAATAPGTALARARQLVEQGARTLDQDRWPG